MTSLFAESFKSVLARSALLERPWVAELRTEAYEEFIKTGLPTTKLESWKYTNLQSLNRRKFISSSEDSQLEEVNSETVKSWMKGQEDAQYFVFANGRFVPSLSSPTLESNGCSITTLAAFFRNAKTTEGVPADLQNLVEQSMNISQLAEDEQFRLLNTALVEDGLVVHVRRGVEEKRPVVILHLSGQSLSGQDLSGAEIIGSETDREEKSIAVAPRTIIFAEPNSEVSVVEIFSCQAGPNASQGYLVAPVTQIQAQEGARVQHLKIQTDSCAAYHLSTIRQKLSANSNVKSAVINLGALISRNEISATLLGEGAEADIKGLSVLKGTQHIDNHIAVEHKAPHCESQQTFRGVFGEQSHGVFTGTIVVDRDAQKTNAYQSNRNLLLTDQAAVDSRPQLRIFADDVKCSHGATVGQLDNDGLFYLRSRGIPLLEAQLILAISFSSAVLGHLPLPIFDESLEAEVRKRLEECF